MADNVSINPGTGTPIATDDIGGVQYQRVKVCYGPDGSATDASADNPLPVTFAGSGGLTDAELRASAVPVSGTFYPATQPISGTVSVSGSVSVTGSFYQATQPVSIASMPSTPVTGTFWQATQPVSGPLTDTQLRATSVPVSLTSTTITGSVAVTGTFWQATQPVSGPLTDTQLRASAVPVVAPTLTKGTQGSTGLSTQHLRDSGRAIVNAATAIAGVTAVTSEALLTLAISRDGAATSNATTIAVTSGKRLRIIGITAGVISTAAAVISARVCLRMNPSGAAAANSPILAVLPLSQQAAALAQAGDTCVLMFSEAIEISGTMQVGLSQVASVTTGTIWASLIAYEY